MNPLPEVRAGAACALLVSLHREFETPAWADVARSAHVALLVWAEKRHSFVFADFGVLGDNFTGPRLARELRRRDPRLVIYLTSAAVEPAQVLWAKSCGAQGVVPRDPVAMAAVLPPRLVHRPPRTRSTHLA